MRPTTKAKLLLLVIAIVGGFMIAVFKFVIVPILTLQEPYSEVSGGIRGQNYKAEN